MRLNTAILPVLAALALCLGPFVPPVGAQEGLNPFAEPETSRPAPAKAPDKAPGRPASGRPLLAPMGPIPEFAPGGGQRANMRDERPQGPIDERSRAVERGELEPVTAADGSGLPYELWRGLSIGELEDLIAALEIPPRSAALHALWRRLMTSEIAPSAEAQARVRLVALRVEALDRSGLLDEAAEILAKEAAGVSDPRIATLLALSETGLGNRDRGCEIARGSTVTKAEMPARLKAEAILLSGYCAAAAGNMVAASLQAGLARELMPERSAGPDALDAIASGIAPELDKSAKVSLLDYRLFELKGGVEPGALVQNATPGLLSALARGPATDPALKLAAGEAAAAIHALTPDDLAAIYRAQRGVSAREPIREAIRTTAAAGGQDPAARRAALFNAAESERTPLKKARLIRTFLDEARHAGLYWPALELMAKEAARLAPVPEIGWFAETAIEASLASADYERARSWAAFASSLDLGAEARGFAHWVALADIADPGLTTGRSANLGSVERMALDGRFDPVLLHRLASALDALDITVPIPLWDAANRTPQPARGHLPETGVLSDLLDASKKKEFGRTVLLVMRTIGPNGAESAHLIALGDAIRALKRAGLEADARRLAFEALFAAWPRTVSN